MYCLCVFIQRYSLREDRLTDLMIVNMSFLDDYRCSQMTWSSLQYLELVTEPGVSTRGDLQMVRKRTDESTLLS